jgi:hypothetical protein
VAVHDFSGRLMRRDRLTAMLALAAGVGAVLLVLGSDRERSPAAASAALALGVRWAYIGSGLIARRQRPENGLGTVMVFIGFAWFATFLADAGSSLVFTLGKAVESIYLLGFVYLVLSFPTGRLRSTLDRALIGAAIAIVTVVELAWLLFADSHSQICSQCPHNAFEIARNDSVANGILQGQRTVGVVLSLLTVALHTPLTSRVRDPTRGFHIPRAATSAQRSQRRRKDPRTMTQRLMATSSLSSPAARAWMCVPRAVPIRAERIAAGARRGQPDSQTRLDSTVCAGRVVAPGGYWE